MSIRLNNAREQLAAAKKEFDAAFRAEGFSPVRAEKAQSRLVTTKAALVSAIAGEQGELNRERALGNLERRLAGAQRVLRAMEFNLRRALRDVSGIPECSPFESVVWRLEDLRANLEADLRKSGLKPTHRARLERNRDLLAEAQYRLDEVKDVRDQVASLEADIQSLKASQAAA